MQNGRLELKDLKARIAARKLTPAEEGERAAKSEYLQDQTNFTTASETKEEIKRNLFEAAGYAREITRLTDKTINDSCIDILDDQEIENIVEQLDNRIGLVTEYLRDLKKFKRFNK